MKTTILFLCQYGGAKSVMAASYFNNAHDLPFRAVAAAAEEPYDSVPAPVVKLLAQDGVDVRDFKPRRVDAQDVQAAARVISIDCDFAGEGERWDDVPKVSEDLEGAAEAIWRHVDELVKELRGR